MTLNEMIYSKINLIHEIRTVKLSHYRSFKAGADEKQLVHDGNTNADYDSDTCEGYFVADIKGTMEDGRSEILESHSVGDKVSIINHPNKNYADNLDVVNNSGQILGSFPYFRPTAALLNDNIMVNTGSSIKNLYKKSEKGSRARKADLFVELKFKLNDIPISKEDTCCIVSFGKDSDASGTQKIEVKTLAMSLDDAKQIFELYYRSLDDYVCKVDKPFAPANIAGWEDELLVARQARRSKMIPGEKYTGSKNNVCFAKFVASKIHKDESKRYKNIKRYDMGLGSVIAYEYSLAELLYCYTFDVKTYYWLNNQRVNEEEYMTATINGLSEWHEMIQLYPSKDDIPVDFDSCDGSILGAAKFEELADVTGMTAPDGLSFPLDDRILCNLG